MNLPRGKNLEERSPPLTPSGMFRGAHTPCTLQEASWGFRASCPHARSVPPIMCFGGSIVGLETDCPASPPAPSRINVGN